MKRRQYELIPADTYDRHYRQPYDGTNPPRMRPDAPTEYRQCIGGCGQTLAHHPELEPYGFTYPVACMPCGLTLEMHRTN